MLLAAACSDRRPIATEPVHQPFLQAGVIASTEPVFAFLSPLGDATQPAGVFDALAAPVAQVCSYSGAAWSEADCAAPEEEWTVSGKGPRKLGIVGEAYEATWRTKANQNQSLTYRIRVLVGGVERGFIDAGYDPAMAGPGYYVLTRREALAVRFWVGADPDPELVPDRTYTQTLNTVISDLQPGFGVMDTQNSGCGQIQNVKVRMNIEHPLIADLRVVLSFHSLATPGIIVSVTLHNQTGGLASNLIGTYPDELLPAESLDAFLGKDLDGRWTLQVSDNTPGNSGTFREWGLDIWCATP
jgi:subtilisin-like proprotein convertase family protein